MEPKFAKKINDATTQVVEHRSFPGEILTKKLIRNYEKQRHCLGETLDKNRNK